MKRTRLGTGLTLVTALLLVGKSLGLLAAEPWPLDTFEARARLVVDAAMTDVAKLNGGSTMHDWMAQRLFEQGKRDQTLAIVKPGVKAMRTLIEKREAARHENIGANGFIYWASLNCYVHWHGQFDQELLDDYRYVFTHGIHSKRVQFAQHRGSLVLLARGLDETNDKYPYVALGATQPFEWNPKSRVLCGSRRPDDSDFRIRGTNIAVGLETALPAEFPAATPAAQLATFREAVRKGSQMALAVKPAGITARFVDRDGVAIERTFDGDTRVNGQRVAYETWPLVENPWMRQEYGGNLTVTDGKTTRVYDVTNWTIIEETRP